MTQLTAEISCGQESEKKNSLSLQCRAKARDVCSTAHPLCKKGQWNCTGQLPGGPAGDGETPVGSATCLTILSGHPWRPAGSSLPSSTRFTPVQWILIRISI